jgi:iron complex transport system permease protein
MIVIRTRGGLSVRLRPRAAGVAAASLLAALGMGVLAIGGGDFPMSPAEVLRTISGSGSPAAAFVVTEIRLPRAGTALAVGAALGLAGALFQSLVRNPLGSPDILGFTQGSATGVLAVIVIAGGTAGSLAVAGGAVAGGAATGALILMLTGRRGGPRLVLTGIGVAAILTGVNGYLLTKAQIVDAARAVLWLTGSLDGRDWADAGPLLVVLVAAVPLVLGYARPLAVLEMGEEMAHGLGVRVARVRLVLLATAVLLVSFAAAAAGPVAFVALTAPQLARRLTGAPGPNLLPSLCVGAGLVMAADLAAQRAVPGHQLPVGVVTGLLGGGYLIWLLVIQRGTGRI